MVLGLSISIFTSDFAGYLSIATVLSLACSVTSLFDGSSLWYFLVIQLLAILIDVISWRRDRHLPAPLRAPLDHTARFLTPLTLGISLLLLGQLPAWNYVLIFGVGTANLALLWLHSCSFHLLDATRAGAGLTLMSLGVTISARSPHLALLDSFSNPLPLLLWLSAVILVLAAWVLVDRRRHRPAVGVPGWGRSRSVRRHTLAPYPQHRTGATPGGYGPPSGSPCP